MNSQSDDARAARLMRQTLLTGALLGVDFVPLRAPVMPEGGGGAETVDAREVAPAVPTDAPVVVSGGLWEAASPASPVQPTSPLRPPAHVEVKPPVPAGEIRCSRPSGARDPARMQALLDAVRDRYIADAPHQRFVTDHHSIVFGEGDPCARLMFVGEAPGADEDRLGRPFVGRAGQLLDKMISAMGLKREQVYIANVLKTRPPGNATPTLEEAQICAPYLYDQIRVIQPEVIVTLGLPATRLLLNSTAPMGAMRGRWAQFTFSGPGSGVIGVAEQFPDVAVPVMPTYHPAFLLRTYTPENRQKVWSDLQVAMQRLGLAPMAVTRPD